MKEKKFTKPEMSWMLYDWANSAYSILIASVLPIFVGVVATAAGVAKDTQVMHWSFASSISALVVALISPLLGTLTDYKGLRKKFFAVFFTAGVLAIGSMAFINNYTVMLAVYAFSNLAFSGSLVFYDAFLVDVTSVDRMDKVSSWGFALGYIGGSTIPFIITMAMIFTSSDQGFVHLLPFDAMTAMRIACVITAVWWAVFTIPFFKNVKQASWIEKEPHPIENSFNRMVNGIREIKSVPRLWKFYIAYFCYINGVGAIIMMASKLADAINIESTFIIGGLFLTQIVAFPFSILYNRLGAKHSSKTMILVGIATYIVIAVIGFFMQQGWQFLMLAVLVGTAQGGIQALSRSYYGKMIPDKTRAGEFFGFYSIFGKFESVVGTLLMGIVVLFTDDVHYAIIPVLCLFILGGILMLRTDSDKGIKESDGKEEA